MPRKRRELPSWVYLNAQQQLYSTRRDLAKARYETLVNGLRLKAAVGTLGEADLAELDSLLDIR